MATSYYYAAYFNTPMDRSPNSINSHHPLGISSHARDLPITPAKILRQDSVISDTERRITNQDTPPKTQMQSRLFRLPPELRNKIYEELLCPTTMKLKQVEKLDIIPPAPTLHPSILSTCRRAHLEAIDLLYSTSIFHAHPSLLTSLPHLHTPSKPILYPASIARIKRWQISLRLDTDPRFSAEQATKAFSGAEFLEIRVWQSMFGGADESVLRLFTGVRGVKVVRIIGVGKELAEWLECRMMGEVEREVEEEGCRCREGQRKLVCRGCGKGVRQEKDEAVEWFGVDERDAWTFGNR